MHSLYHSNKTTSPASNTYMRHHIHLIFIYYSSFGDRNNYHHLKQQNYRRFLIDSQIVKTTQQFPVFDILFKKISKANSNIINFQDFLKLLPELSNTIFEQQSTQSAFKKFVKITIKKLQEQIRLNSQFGTDLQIIQSTVNNKKKSNDQIEIIKKLQESSIIKKCFQKYIASTSMHQKSAQDTFQSIYKFLKDFQISPQLLYKSICYVAFICLLMSKPQNQRNKFQLSEFVEYILVLSEVIASKQYNDEINLCAIGKISKILQKMQVSAGFQKISKQIKGQSYYSMSLVRFVIGEHINFSDKDNCLQSMQHSFDKMSSCQQRHKYCSIQNHNSKTVNLNSSYQSIENLIQSEPTQLKHLKKIFEDLCSYGEVANNKTLKSMKIKKMYNQLGLLKGVTQIWLDLMITQLVRKSPSGKMQFLQFMQLLNETSKKIQITKQDMYRLITNEYSSLTENSRLHTSKFQVKEDDVQLLMEMLSSISYPLQKIFHFYSRSKNEISFSQLTKLMYDFQVFPAILTKTKLYQIFVDCVNQSNNNREEKLKNEETNSKYDLKSKYASNQANLKLVTVSTLVDEKMLPISCFPLLLLQTSNQLCDQSLTSCQKLIILIQKMHESKGQQKVVMGKGTLVSQLRKRYSKIYKMNFSSNPKKPEVKQTINVDDLLDSISEY